MKQLLKDLDTYEGLYNEVKVPNINHQKKSGRIPINFVEYKDFPNLDERGILEVVQVFLDTKSEIMSIYESKRERYGDTLSIYSNRALIEQIIGKIHQLSIFECVKDNDRFSEDFPNGLKQVCNELKLYLSVLWHKVISCGTIEDCFNVSLREVVKKEFLYGSSWRCFSNETLIKLILVKIERHKEGSMDFKTLSDIEDAINYLTFLQLNND